MIAELLGDASFWGDLGRLACAHDGPFAGLLVLVWPGRGGWWIAAEEARESVGDVRWFAADDAAAVLAEWGLEWLPRSRSESRLEAERFGIRPSMNPAAGVRQTERPRITVTTPLFRAWSPGARWIAVPYFALYSMTGVGSVVLLGEGDGLSTIVLLGFVIGVPSALLFVRAWWVSIRVADEGVVVRGWVTRRVFPREDVTGFAVAEYRGGIVGLPWEFSSGAFVSLRVLQEDGAHRDLHAIFGTPRRMRRIAAGLTLALEASGGTSRST